MATVEHRYHMCLCGSLNHEKCDLKGIVSPTHSNKMDYSLDSFSSDIKCKDRYAKLCLLGEVGVGKTSLAARFAQDDHHERYKPTLCVQHYQRIVATDGYRFNLVVWDTAGAERFRAMTALSVRGASAILLVFDVAVKSSYDEILHYWLPRARDWAPDALIVMVGNKIDQDLHWAVSQREILQFCGEQDISFYQTSARVGTNVKQFFVEVGTNAIKRIREDVREDEDLMGSFRVAAGDEIWRQPRRVAEKPAEEKDRSKCPDCTIL